MYVNCMQKSIFTVMVCKITIYTVLRHVIKIQIKFTQIYYLLFTAATDSEK